MKLQVKGGKLDWKKWVSLFLFLITLGSSLVYGALQSLTSQKNQTGVTLPTQNIIDYELTAEQKTLAYKLYKTILEYRHPLACKTCSQEQAYLESAANAYPSQLILETITDNAQTESVLFVSSYYGSETVRAPSAQTVLPVLCGLMYERPLQCATLSLATTAPTTTSSSSSTTTIPGNATQP